MTPRRADFSFARVARVLMAVGAIATVSGCVVRADGAVSTQGTPGMELDVNRPGSDYHNFDLSAPRPEHCRDACASDGRCEAYTYVRPGVQGPNARCWLKSRVPNAVTDTCCVSGAKGYAAAAPSPPSPPPADPSPPPPPPPPPPSPATSASAVATPTVRGTAATPPPPPIVYQPIPGGGPLEHDVDRSGHDIQGFDLPQPDPSLCQRACLNNPGCAAFTYVRPGFQGANPRCWLKNAVPNAVAAKCCVSGVKPGGAAPPPPDPRGGHGNWRRHDNRDRRDERDHHHRRGDARQEHNANRPGADFQNFDLPRPDPDLCQRACWDRPECRAFTYVRPGVHGPTARCWLKNAVPAAVPDNCCVSGVR